MITAAAATWDLDLGASSLIGDRWVDIAAAEAAGVRSVLLEREYSWAPREDSWRHRSSPDVTSATLTDCGGGASARHGLASSRWTVLHRLDLITVRMSGVRHAANPLGVRRPKFSDRDFSLARCRHVPVHVRARPQSRLRGARTTRSTTQVAAPTPPSTTSGRWPTLERCAATSGAASSRWSERSSGGVGPDTRWLDYGSGLGGLVRYVDAARRLLDRRVRRGLCRGADEPQRGLPT